MNGIYPGELAEARWHVAKLAKGVSAITRPWSEAQSVPPANHHLRGTLRLRGLASIAKRLAAGGATKREEASLDSVHMHAYSLVRIASWCQNTSSVASSRKKFPLSRRLLQETGLRRGKSSQVICFKTVRNAVAERRERLASDRFLRLFQNSCLCSRNLLAKMASFSMIGFVQGSSRWILPFMVSNPTREAAFSS